MATEQAITAEQNKSDNSLYNLKFLGIGIVCVLAFVILSRWYQGWAAWEYGMDSTAPEFQTYWMALFYANISVFSVLFVAGTLGLWMTRDKNLPALKPAVELRRYTTFIGMLVVYAFAFVFAGSFFAEQDASWHQVVVRDTSFTPSHIVEFYGMFPMFIVLGFSSYVYAITRLPLFSKSVSIPLLMVVAGPMMVLPNVGFNEWGHAFWLMEEVFTVPLHWGFVFFGWAILALGGVLVQVMSRLGVLIHQVIEEDESAQSAA